MHTFDAQHVDGDFEAVFSAGLAATAATIATAGLGIALGPEVAAISAVSVSALATLTYHTSRLLHRFTGGPTRLLTAGAGLTEAAAREVETVYRTVSNLASARLADLVGLGCDVATARRLIGAAQAAA